MRVCIIAQQSISMVAGGPRIQALQTARYLPEYGVEVEFFNAWQEYDWSKFDLAHIFGANHMTYDIALRLHQFGVPFVVSSIFFSERGPAFMRFAGQVETVANKLFSGIWTDYGFTRRVCQLSRRVLPNTSEEAKLISEGLGIEGSKVEVIPNGVEERFYHADPALFVQEYGLRDFILNVGHIGSQRKNVLSLVRALKDIDHPAVIVGKIHRNAYSDRCLKEAAQNPNIRIIDGLANDSPMLESAYAASRVFAFPSYFETPGIAALEAGLAGSSVVITKYGGTRDYFGDKAIYVEPHSVRSITEGITTALHTERSSALREHIRREFLWPVVAEKTARAYRRVVG
jgi:glycosyltransferase involved in cell wall biosynthesis